MYWARAVKGKGTRVFRGSVALMILQSVAGVKRGEFRHGPIARDLDDDRRGGDRRTARVALDDRDFPAGQTGFLVAIDETKMRLHAQARDRAAHGQKTRAENIVRLDFLDRGDSDGPMNFSVTAQEGAQLRPAFGFEHLRVVEMAMPQAVGQNRRRRVDRPRPATAPDFIHARDDRPSLGTQPALECPGQGGSPHGPWP